MGIDFYSTGKYPHGAQFFYVRNHLIDISRKMNLDMYRENIVLELDGRIGKADLQLVLEEQSDKKTEYRVAFEKRGNPVDRVSRKILIDEILGTVFDHQALEEIKRVEENQYSDLSAADRIRLMMCSEEHLLENVITAVANLQNNAYFNKNCIENILNDFVRDMLYMIYYVKDQPRHGKSSSGQDAGEADIIIYRDKNRELAIIEALRLGSLNLQTSSVGVLANTSYSTSEDNLDNTVKNGKAYLDEHVLKALTKYDTHGVPFIYILIYFTGSKFGDFWKKVEEYFQGFSFPYSSIDGVQNIDTGYADLRCISQKLDRNGTKIKTYLIAVKLDEGYSKIDKSKTKKKSVLVPARNSQPKTR